MNELTFSLVRSWLIFVWLYSYAVHNLAYLLVDVCMFSLLL